MSEEVEEGEVEDMSVVTRPTRRLTTEQSKRMGSASLMRVGKRVYMDDAAMILRTPTRVTSYQPCSPS